MKNRVVWIGGGLIVAATAAYSLWILPQLPATIATHWGPDGKPDGWSSREYGVWFGVGMQIVLLLLLGFLPAISPKKAKMESFEGAWSTVVLAILGFIALVQFLITRAALGPLDMVRTMMIGMMALFLIMGNVIGKAKRNYFMGVRTPWTLESDQVWHQTHRLAGKLMVGGAIVGLILLAVGLNPLWTVAIILISTLYPVLYSYLLYKKLHPNGKAQA